MCGFVGIHRSDGKLIDARQLSGLASIIAHRGPDGDGVWVGAQAGLAHRRLAIIDPNGSPQPMHSSDETLHISFNGEILNYRGLRDGLDYPFQTNGDTEVLLALHRERGPAAVAELRGQFAYAIHDETTRETWLVRDRIGVLPVYYVERPGWVAFASEIKALLPLIPNVEVDEAQLDRYLRRRAVSAPATLYKGVRKLLPGHMARIDVDGRLTISRYWSPADAPDRRVSDEEAISLVRRSLDDAVDDNLVADVPVGSYLSGGLDSSLIAALAAKRTQAGSLHTFSAGFGDHPADELPFARRVSDAIGTVHHVVDVRPSDFEDLWPRLAWHRDAPLSEPADVAVYRLAQAASEHVKVVLSGEGADEVFGGYPKYRLARLTTTHWPAPVRGALSALEPHLPPRVGRARQAMRALSAPTASERVDAWFSPFTGGERAALLGDRVRLPGPPAEASIGSPLRTMLTSDCGSWLSDNLLERGDRMTMAASIELRPPFLDHRLIELGLSLPDRMKVRNGRGKWVLRQIAADHLPPEILARPKVGFRVPLDQWFRGGLRDMAWDRLLSPSSFVGQVFDRNVVEELLQRHDRSRSDENIRIWTLLSLEVWHGATFGATTSPAGNDL